MEGNAQENQQSLGHRRVRASFNPSYDSAVDRIKRDSGNLINEVATIQEVTADPEVKRLCSLAMTAYEEAAMWAVKAATATK